MILRTAASNAANEAKEASVLSPAAALHALRQHAAVLRVEVRRVVPDGRRVVGGAVGRRGAHPVAVRRRGAPEEGPEPGAG